MAKWNARRVRHKLAAAAGLCVCAVALARSADGQPVEDASGRIGVQSRGLGILPGDVRILSDHLYDYTFSDPPTDWVAGPGHWEVTARWTCSPQWSWLGGYAHEGPACIWNKRQFEGDVTVEVYAAFMMMGTDRRVQRYWGPNDLNITICGDGANLASGYSFIYAGEFNHVTRIVKGTQTLAETREPEALLTKLEHGWPPGNNFHQKWWSLRARKRGDLLQLYVDERLICEAHDPEPLDSGRIAVWTRDNGIVLSRVKIYYEREKLPSDPSPTAHLRARSAAVVERPHIALSIPSHPAIEHDFESNLCGWQSRGGAQGAMLTLDSPGARGSRHCLRVVNAYGGGSFDAAILHKPFDLREMPRLSFDYQLSPDAKINLYLTVAGRLYEIGFSGPTEGAPRSEMLGRIEDVVADGRWRQACFDLLGHLEARLRNGTELIAKDLFIGNLCRRDYLDCGFGGNPAGSSVCIDNLILDAPGGREIECQARSAPGVGCTEYQFALSRERAGWPKHSTSVADGRAVLGAQADGIWYVHARPTLADGSSGQAITRRVRVDTTAPKVLGVQPEDSVLRGNDPFVINVTDQSGAGIAPSSVAVRVGETELEATHEAVSYDPTREAILVDLVKAGVQLAEPGQVTVSLAELADRRGNALPKPVSWAFRSGPDCDEAGPEPPWLLVGDGPLMRADFETDLCGCKPWREQGAAVVSRDPTTAAGGRWSLKLCSSRVAGHLGACVLDQPFDAGKYCFVSFDYEIPECVSVDLIAVVEGRGYNIRLTDSDLSHPVIGEVRGVMADGRWHHAEFNICEMLREAGLKTHTVERLLLADSGWCSTPVGAAYHIDDFEILPIHRPRSVTASWGIADLSGPGGANWSVDTNRHTELETNVRTRDARIEFAQLPDVDGWLHVRACDGAGNWSDTAHHRLVVDGSGPVVGDIGPKPGARAAASKIVIGLADRGSAGLDSGSVVLAVNGKDYTVADAALSYDHAEGKLVWDYARAESRMAVIPDGSEFVVEVKSAADCLGNGMAEPVRWSWVMDHSMDKTPPEVVSITSRTHDTHLAYTFEDGLNGWRSLMEDAPAVELDTSTAASGRGSLRLTKRAGARMAAVAAVDEFAADRFSTVAFDYRIDQGVELSLMIRLHDRWRSICVTGTDEDALGAIPVAVADGTWRHAQVDVAPLLRGIQPRGALTVQGIMIAEPDGAEHAVGVSANFDNFVITRVGKGRAALRWKAQDVTGIAGYSYILDPEPATVPPPKLGDSRVAKVFDDLEPGLWFLHVRAVDGAGNWGRVTHYAIVQGQP